MPDAVAGSLLRDILPAQGALPVSVTRSGSAQLPSPEMVLEGGDVLHVSATLEGIEALRTRLNKKMEA